MFSSPISRCQSDAEDFGGDPGFLPSVCYYFRTKCTLVLPRKIIGSLANKSEFTILCWPASNGFALRVRI